MIDIHIGDCREVLKTLPSKSVNCCVTSPPYWGLRDYQTGTWEGGDPNCPHMRTTKISKDTVTGHKAMHEQGNVVGDAIYRSTCPKCGAVRKDSQLGLEETPSQFVNNLVQVFREVHRVLRDDGTLWLNLGDSYYNYRADGKQVKQTVANTRQDFPESSPHRANKIDGLKQKDLIGIPWRVAFALQDDGWYLRQDIIWHKPNPMPESVKDRCTKSHEYIFLFSKNKNYYYDIDAIREPHTWEETKPRPSGMARNAQKYREKVKYGGGGTGLVGHSGTFKEDGSPLNHPLGKNKRSVWTITTKPYKEAHFAVFPTELIEPCVKAGCPEEGTVLDPFGGSGTTGLVADRLGRNAKIIELNKDYIELANNRVMNDAPLFTDVSIR
jgi:DNA modification methylase